MKIMALTGAGISAESGLGTFRGADGLWQHFDPRRLATPEAFARDPDTVQAFYNARRRNLLAARPNAAHMALARLGRDLAAAGGELVLVTQNIDDLHEQAGSDPVIHMHGELLKARCTLCGAVTAWRDDLGATDACPTCHAAPALRPHVVWFGEIPFCMAEITHALDSADLFVAIGTSGSVYPAASLVMQARAASVQTCELNLEPSENAAAFDQRHYGAASEIVPAWVEAMLSQA